MIQPAKEEQCPSQSHVRRLPGRPQPSAAQAYKPNPVWFKPVMFGLMIIGLLWIITFYISEGALPGPGLGLVEHRGRLRHRDRGLPDDHTLAFLTRRHMIPGRRHQSSATMAWPGRRGPPSDPLLREYYDNEWGLPVRDEQGLYERISLEGFQAGLSWATILRKRPAFRAAFYDFHPETVAAFTDADVERLCSRIRASCGNRLKIRAAITNAKATIALRHEGGLVDFVWEFQPHPPPAPHYADVPTTSAGVHRPFQGPAEEGLRLRGAHHHVRPHGGHRHGGHTSCGQPPPGTSGVWPQVSRRLSAGPRVSAGSPVLITRPAATPREIDGVRPVTSAGFQRIQQVPEATAGCAKPL